LQDCLDKENNKKNRDAKNKAVIDESVVNKDGKAVDGVGSSFQQVQSTMEATASHV